MTKYSSKAQIKNDLDSGKKIIIYADRIGTDLQGRVVTIPRDLKLTFYKLTCGDIVRERNGMIRTVDEKSTLQFIWDWRKGAELDE